MFQGFEKGLVWNGDYCCAERSLASLTEKNLLLLLACVFVLLLLCLLLLLISPSTTSWCFLRYLMRLHLRPPRLKKLHRRCRPKSLSPPLTPPHARPWAPRKSPRHGPPAAASLGEVPDSKLGIQVWGFGVVGFRAKGVLLLRSACSVALPGFATLSPKLCC